MSRGIAEKSCLVGTTSYLVLSGSLLYAVSPDDQAAAAACLGLSGTCLFFWVGLVVLNIVIMVWVVRDAKARGVGAPIGWLILVMITGVLGLIIYVFSRPKGDVIQCPNCGNKRLKAMARCPHCGSTRQPATTSMQPTGNRFCTECGAKNETGSLFCGECGSKLE